MGKETRSMWLILFLLGELRMFEAPTFWVFFSQESHSQRDWLGEGGAFPNKQKNDCRFFIFLTGVMSL